MKRVPTHTPSAPSASAAARPRPSKIPPAATTGTRSPTASTICGHERQRRDLTGVATGLGALRDDDVAAGLDRVDRVADLAAHREHQHRVLVAERDHVARHAEARRRTRVAPSRMSSSTSVSSRSGSAVSRSTPSGFVVSAFAARISRDHLVGAHRRCAEAAEAAGLGDRGHEGAVRHAPHPGEHHGVLDAEHVSQAGAA